MLYSFLTSLVDSYSFLNVFKYLTFRTGLSVITSLTIVFLIGGPLIKIFSRNQITGPIRQDRSYNKKNWHTYNGRTYYYYRNNIKYNIVG